MSNSLTMSHNAPVTAHTGGLIFNDETRIVQTSRSRSFFRYLPSKPELPKQSIELTGLGKSTVLPGEPYPLPGHPSLYNFNWNRGRTLPEFQILLITDGVGELETKAEGRTILEAPALIILQPGVWHRYRPLQNSGWTERWLSFDGQAAHSLFDASLSSTSNSGFSHIHAQNYRANFDELLEGFREDSEINHHRFALRAMRIIVEAANHLLGESVHCVEELGTSESASGRRRCHCQPGAVLHLVE